MFQNRQNQILGQNQTLGQNQDLNIFRKSVLVACPSVLQ